MKTMSVGEFKTNFSEVLRKVEAGEKIAITYGKTKKIRAYLVPKDNHLKPRKLGILQGKVKAVISKNFKLTEEDFLGL